MVLPKFSWVAVSQVKVSHVAGAWQQVLEVHVLASPMHVALLPLFNGVGSSHVKVSHVAGALQQLAASHVRVLPGQRTFEPLFKVGLLQGSDQEQGDLLRQQRGSEHSVRYPGEQVFKEPQLL